MRVIAILLLALTAAAAELPVTKVVLYKHGVGYFERAGELSPGETARLDFKASEMNDVLKSLTVETKAGPNVTALRYDASEPVSKKLSEFPLRLEKQQPLSALLDQLKGARLELKAGGETIAGVIVGARTVAATREQPEREQVTLLADSGDLRTLELPTASSVRFPDPALQLQLKDYLATLLDARSTEKRTVYIDSVDTGRRQVTASYMIPTPVWKSSYRLIFGASGQPVLEGWAIVDNTTGDDWTKVRLALVSGRPISFISRLYEPRYRERQVAELPEERAQGPVVHAGGFPLPPPAPMREVAPKPAQRLRDERQMAPMAGLALAETVEVAAARESMASTVAGTAEGQELGELFEYRFGEPVTVRKNESAMLPFLQQKVDARKLLIYAERGTQHPLNAAEITNSTGKTLDGGPITVFDAGAYAGEALVETFKTGDKRLISYGIDLGTRITTQFDSESERVREVHLRRGVLTTKAAVEETKTYTIRNVDQKPKTLIIEHPARPGYKLLNQKPSETTGDAYRFEVKLAANGSEKFPVVEEHVYENTLALVNQTPDFLLSLIQNKELNASARQALERIVAQKRQIADNDNEIRRTDTEINELVRDQERIRQNITSLSRVSGQQEQVQKYARDLAAQETTLASLRDRLSELRKKKAALESELNNLIESMSF